MAKGKQLPEIKKIARKIFTLSMKLSEKGIDVFFTYSPHVEWVDIRIHLKGWHTNNEYDKLFMLSLTDSLIDTSLGVDNTLAYAEYVLEYIQGLLK